MTHQPKDKYRRLRGIVRMLAADATAQVTHLGRATAQAKYRVLADDVTTEFGCWFQGVEDLTKHDLISAHTLESLTKLANQISSIDADRRWTVDDLASFPGWATVRQQARIILTLMDNHYPDGAL